MDRVFIAQLGGLTGKYPIQLLPPKVLFTTSSRVRPGISYAGTLGFLALLDYVFLVDGVVLWSREGSESIRS